MRTALILALLAASVHAENWPQWRGQRTDGTSLDKGFPVKVEPGNTVWRTELPGEGHASPIVWNDRVFVVACLPETTERVLICLDRASGKVLWQSTVVKSAIERIHPLNSHASSTPATDGERVFTSFLDQTETAASREANAKNPPAKGKVPKGNVVISAHDFNGKLLWQVHPGLFSSQHGYCASPVLFKDKVIVNCDHDGDGFMVALARDTGKELWRIERPNHTRSYCVPLIRELAGRTQMVLSGTKCLTSYDPNDGKLIWMIDGPTEQFVASFVYSDRTGLLYMTGGFPEHHFMAIRPDGTGNVTQTHVQWHTNKGVSYVPSPLVQGDHLFNVSDSGIGHCFDAKTGEIVWTERMKEHHASLTSADGLVYFLNDFGTLRAVKPGPQYECVGLTELGEKFFASPALSDGQLFLRGEKTLMCVGKKQASVAAH